LVAHDAVRLSPTAARVVRRIADSAGVIDALLAVAVAIGPTAETFATISRTERRLAIAAVVIIRIAGEADLSHTLAAITIGVGLTGHAAAAISHAEWRGSVAPGVIYRITGSAGVTDAFGSGPAAIAITTTGHTRPGVSGLDTERRVLRAARVAIARVTGETVARYALTGRRIITVVIVAAADALIAVGALHTIGRGLVAAAIIIELTRLALRQGAERLGWVITLEISCAIPTDVSVGRLYTER